MSMCYSVAEGMVFIFIDMGHLMKLQGDQEFNLPFFRRFQLAAFYKSIK